MLCASERARGTKYRVQLGMKMKTQIYRALYENFSFARYSQKCVTQIYRALYGDAMLVLIRMGTNMAAGNQQKHLSLSLIHI